MWDLHLLRDCHMVPLNVALFHNSFIAELLLIKTNVIFEDEQILTNEEFVDFIVRLAVSTLITVASPQVNLYNTACL